MKKRAQFKEYDIGDSHSFRVLEAKQYGIECAILLQNIRFWCRTNLANEENIYDGYVWTYNSAEAYSKLFPYIAPRTITNHLIKLVKIGVLKKGDYSEDRYVRPNYYTIPSEFALQDANDKGSVTEDNSLKPNNDKSFPNLPIELSEFTNREPQIYQSTNRDLPIEPPDFSNVYKETDVTSDVTSDVTKNINSARSKEKTTSFDYEKWVKKNMPSFVLPSFINPEKWKQWQEQRKKQRRILSEFTFSRDIKVLTELFEKYQITSDFALDCAIAGNDGLGWQMLSLDYFQKHIRGNKQVAAYQKPQQKTKTEQRTADNFELCGTLNFNITEEDIL
jgi:hypothetical protein